MSFFRTIAKGFGNSAAAIAVTRAGLFANFALLSRLLPVDQVGMYVTAITTLSLFASLSMVGIHTATARMVAAQRSRTPSLIGVVLFNSLFVAAVLSVFMAALIAFAGPALGSFVRSPGFAGVLRLAVWSLPFVTLWTVANSGLQGMEDFAGYRDAMLASPVLLLPLTFLLTRAWGLEGAIQAVILANALALGVAVRILVRCMRRNELRLEFVLRRPLIGEMVRASLPLMLGNVLIAVAWWLATLYLARTHGFAQVGFFAAALGVFQVLQLMPGALSVPNLPVLTRRHVEVDVRNFRDLTDDSCRFVWVLSLPLVSAICLLAEPIAVSCFGHSFAPAANAIRWMAAAGLISAVSSSLGMALISAGRIWAWCAFTSAWFALFAAFAILATPTWGATGTAMATFLSVLLSSALVWHYSVATMQLGLRFLPRTILVSGIALLSSGMLARVLRGVNVLEATLIGSTVVLIGAPVAALLVLIPSERRTLMRHFIRTAGSD